MCPGGRCPGRRDGKRCLGRGRFDRLNLYATSSRGSRTDLGLGSCWCQVRNREREDESGAGEYIRQLLDIPYQLEVLSIIGFGHKAQERKPFDESRLQWEKVHIDRFTMPEPDSDEEGKA